MHDHLTDALSCDAGPRAGRTPTGTLHGPHVLARLADGGTVALRPLRRGEVDVVEAVFGTLSPRSRQQRFLVPTPRLTGTARRVLADVDGHDHVAWVALVEGRPVGTCRYVRTAPQTAELAFEVADAHHGRGIGTALLDAVTTVACARGVRRVEAVADPGNQASVALLARLGVRWCPEDGLLEGRGELRLLRPSRVDRRAVRLLDARAASTLTDEPLSVG